MKYLLLIHSDENAESRIGETEMGQLMADYGTFTTELTEAGVMLGADRLKASTTATTVRVRDGELLTTDGPFAETKEQLGGYYMIDVANLDEAISWARKIPTAAYGSVEVRPIWED